MANVQNYPKLTINIEGKAKVTDLYQITNFLPTGKLESEVSIDVNDSYISVFSNLALPVRMVWIEAPIWSPTTETEFEVNVKTTYNDPVSGNIDIIESVEGLFFKRFPERYGARIVDIQVSTTATADYPKIIKSRLYGWED